MSAIWTETQRHGSFSPPGWRAAWLGMDRNPAMLAHASTRVGSVVVCILFIGALLLGRQLPPVASALISLTILGCMALPNQRLAIMSAAGILYFCARPFRTAEQTAFVQSLEGTGALPGLFSAVPLHMPVAALLLVLCLWLLRRIARTPGSAIARRPVLVQFVFFCALVTAGVGLPANGLLHAVVWTFAVTFAASFFYVAYLLTEARAKADLPDAVRLGFIRPFWSGPSIPIKGPSYLRKFEAADAEQLAATRLKALKLIVWAAILAGLCRLIEAGAYDFAGLSSLQPAIAAAAEGEGPGRPMAWFILFKSFLLNVLSLGAILHTLVAIIRMCGYGVPRGMARPLSSRTIAEFWNRYFFYFKELLVDFFFYPAFIRYFKKSPKLRIAFATFCAAFVGNLLFSILSQAQLFAQVGPWDALWRFDSYAVYAAALTLALIASQLRAHKPRPEHGFLRYEVTPRVTVLGFFCLAQIFADESGRTSLAERAHFLGYLVGV